MSGQDYSGWCRTMFGMLAEGGVWGVPRSGLIFRKEGARLVLHETMPFEPGMPGSPEELAEYQSADFELIREQFAAAGIEVTR